MEKTTVIIKKGEGRSLKAGGPWIYSNEIASIMGTFEPGDVVMVKDFDGYPLGKGFFNPYSKIAVRMLTRDPETVIDDEFWRKQVKRAWEYRKKTVDTSSCRVIFGEADFLPGLTVDKYEDVLVVSSMSMGIDRVKDTILRLLKEILAGDGVAVRGIYERSEAGARLKEGLEPVKGFIGEAFDTQVKIRENGLYFLVDVENGQKTGYFLDQKNNRAAIRSICKDAEVLDCFTHTGSFALNAAAGGAASVLAVDVSEDACERARLNVDLNGFGDKVEVLSEDIFDMLPRMEEEGKSFDVVILDPPAFAKSRDATKAAVRGYREINSRGMKLVRDGGFLVTCSCTRFMTYELFTQMLSQAAKTAHCRLRQVEYRTQSPDHPILWGADESYYLKFYIFQVVKA
jgi:23S rRNA (cytosine1962-C5)-methyltransferase